MKKLIYKQIETKRLLLRKPKESDYKYQLEYFSDKSNFPNADFKVCQSISDIENFFQRMFNGFLDTSMFWMICDKSTNRPVGTLSAWNVDWENRTIEFGYSIYPKFRGLGYMKETIKAAIEYLNKSNDFYIFDIWTDNANIASKKLAESLSFKYTGIVVEEAKYSKRSINYATYRLDIREEDTMELNYREVEYKNFGKCLEVNNGTIECIVTLDIGPRIISYKRLDGENIFFEDIHRELQTKNPDMDKFFFEGATWFGLGGHRLWRAPETYSTYYPDTKTVKYETIKNGFKFINNIQEYNEIQMEISLIFLEENKVEFQGKITNKSNVVKTLSAWSLSMCKGPGLEIVKLPLEKTGFTPQRFYSFWDFGAKSNDPRAYYGADYFALRMEPGNQSPIKVGIKVTDGKMLYLNGSNAFVKSFNRVDSEVYPDNNVNYETYTKDLFMEIETLSPLRRLEPNESVTQIETWSLYELKDTIPSSFDEVELERLFSKYAK